MIDSGAEFSDDRKYRFSLWRTWDESKPLLGFCMLNPSTADEVDNDPTIARCQRRAELLGFGGIIITNIFAYRSTDPSKLKKVKNPVGEYNDYWISLMSVKCAAVIMGWGKHGTLMDRGVETAKIITTWYNHAYVLKQNKDGSPAHPLYIGYDVKPIPIDRKLLGWSNEPCVISATTSKQKR